MDKNPKDFRNKSHRLRFWILLLVVSILLGTTAALLSQAFPNTSLIEEFQLHNLLRWIVIYSCVFLLALLFIIKPFQVLIRKLFCWRNIIRSLLVFALLILLVALFYVEEDCRGRWDWEIYKHEMEAKGEKLEFTDFVPAPVPDDQNFALTPIVASCYNRYLDRNGHRIQPYDTNVVDRLWMYIYHYYDCNNDPTNSGWERGQITDLKEWQAYYRSPSPTFWTNTAKPTNLKFRHNRNRPPPTCYWR
jgi:hypothetical protein